MVDLIELPDADREAQTVLEPVVPLLDGDSLTLEQVEPEMSAMVVQLKDSRPADLESVSGLDFLPVAAAAAETFSADTAADTMNRLKRQSATAGQAFRQQLQSVSPETQRYVSALESTVATFRSINVNLIDQLKMLAKKMEEVGEAVAHEVMHHLELVDSQASTQNKASIDTSKRVIFAHFENLNRTLDRVLGRVTQASELGRDDVRGHVRRLNQTLDEKFRLLDQNLDEKLKPLEQVGQEVGLQLEPLLSQSVEKTSSLLIDTAAELHGHQNQTRDHVTAFVGQQLSQNFDRLNKTLDKKFWQLDLTASNLKPLFSQTVEKMSALLNDTAETLEAGKNRTRDDVIAFIDKKLDQLRQTLVADFATTNTEGLPEKQVEHLFNAKMAKWTQDIYHRTEEAESRTRDFMTERFDRVDATLADFRLRFDAQDLVLNKTFNLTASQSALFDKCLDSGLRGKTLLSEYWKFAENLWYDTVPENSDFWHPQNLWDLLDSQKVLLAVVGTAIYIYRFSEDRLSSFWAKKLGVRPHFLCKVFKQHSVQ